MTEERMPLVELLQKAAQNRKRPGDVAEAFCQQVKMVAGTRYHLHRTRLIAPSRR
jgi:hypothetical protein